ncbi:MAG: alpha/beta hydrolase [Geminicoccaceae bacterium]
MAGPTFLSWRPDRTRAVLRAPAAAMLLAMFGTPALACPDTPHRFEAFSLAAPALGHAKRILVYLPPGYDCTDRRYPVLYLNDGHDLFAWNPFAADLEPAITPKIAGEIAAREGWYGSWRLDEQLDRALAQGDLPAMIAVGVASDDGLRSRDLAPVPWDGSAQARGLQYGRFVADTVVPVVDRTWRTIAKARCRGIGGASLGGVSALQIGLVDRQKFGMVLALSPVLRDPAIAAFLAMLWRHTGGAGPRVLIDVDDDPVGHADRQWLESRIGAAPQTILVQTASGRHAIASWADRVIPALTKLFDGSCRG